MAKIIQRFVISESGATAVEYALMCMCIVLVIIAAVATLGTQLNTVYSEVDFAIK